MLKIAEISTDRIPSPPPKGGAIERYVFQLSKEIAKLGNVVYLLSIDTVMKQETIENIIRVGYSLSCAPPERLAGIMMSYISSPLNKNIFCATRMLFSILASISNLDVIHNHYFTTAFGPIAYKRLVNKDSLLIAHYHNVPKDNLINKLLAREYDLHLAVSEYVRKKIVKVLRVPLKKVKTLYNGIDTNEFSCDERGKETLREEYGISVNDIVILFIGRITPEKGLHHLIEAFGKIKKNNIIPSAKLVVAGPIGHFDITARKDVLYYNYIIKLVKELKLDRDVVYLGYIKNNNIAYKIADIVVIPSIWMDPCPTVVMEALASCKPVVAYPVGGIPEILHGLPYDFLTKSVDPDSLTDKIVDVIKNIEKIDKQMLRRHVEKRYSMNVIAKKFIELVKEAD